jgi:hypothetical protein
MSNNSGIPSFASIYVKSLKVIRAILVLLQVHIKLRQVRLRHICEVAADTEDVRLRGGKNGSDRPTFKTALLTHFGSGLCIGQFLSGCRAQSNDPTRTVGRSVRGWGGVTFPTLNFIGNELCEPLLNVVHRSGFACKLKLRSN